MKSHYKFRLFFLITTAIAFFNSNGSPARATAPVITPTPETPLVSASGVVVGNMVNPEGTASKAYFIYGTSSSSLTLSTTPVSIGAGRASVLATAFLPDLQASTTYYYEVVVTNSSGTTITDGPTDSFSTLGFDLSLVSYTGDIAPGTNGATFLAYSAPTINDSDDAAFVAQLNLHASNPTIRNGKSFGIWANQGSSALDLICQTGTTVAPGTTGAFYGGFISQPLINSGNAVAFDAKLKVAPGKATATTLDGIWSTSSGALALVAREGDPAPGGSTFSLFKAVAMTDDATFVAASMADTGGVTTKTDQGIWEGTTESDLVSVLRTGAVVGGSTIIAPLAFTSTDKIVQGQQRAFASATDDVALLATFPGVTNPLLTTTGIVTIIGGTPALPDKVGDVAPGTGTATFSKFSVPIINNSDHIAFKATLATGGGITISNNSGIWANGSGTLGLIAQTGVAPNNFSSLTDPLLNDNNVTAFQAKYKVGNTSVSGLFTNNAGTVTNVAQTGQLAPGCGPGIKFSTFVVMDLPNVGGPGGNGGLVFEATLSGPGIYKANNEGIWAVDSTGTPQLIVRVGDTVNVAASGTPVYKKIETIYFSSFVAVNAGQAIGVSPGGDISYTVAFTGFRDFSDAVFAVQFP